MEYFTQFTAAQKSILIILSLLLLRFSYVMTRYVMYIKQNRRDINYDPSKMLNVHWFYKLISFILCFIWFAFITLPGRSKSVKHEVPDEELPK